MKQEFEAYLTQIGMTLPLVQRVEQILGFYTQAYPEDIIDLVVCDVIKEDGTREYESLWMFSEGCVMEARSFVAKDDCDLLPYKGRVRYWRLEKEKFDGGTASDSSRMAVHFDVGTSTGDLKAAKENCEQLWRIFIKHIVPNIIGGTRGGQGRE